MTLWNGSWGEKLIKAEEMVVNNMMIPTTVEGSMDIRLSCGVKPLRLSLFFIFIP
jgi:hypothetical protein